MANPNDHYGNPSPAGGLQYRPYPDPPQYTGSRGSSFDGDDRPPLGQPPIQGNGDAFYNPQYNSMGSTGGPSIQRSQSTAQPPSSYFTTPPGNNEASIYAATQQSPEIGSSAGYQQQPYPTTPIYSNGSQPPQRPPYNPAAYTGPQRHASTAGGYCATSPSFPPSIGTSYNPSSYGTTPYPTSYAPKTTAPYQPYYNPATTTGYSEYPGRTTYSAQPQQTYGYPPYSPQPGVPSAYRSPPPPPPPPLPPTSPTTFNSSQTYTSPAYNTSSLPYPSHDTPPYPTEGQTRYSSDSEASSSGYGGQQTHSMHSPPPPAPPEHKNLPHRPLPDTPYPYGDEAGSGVTRHGSISHGQTIFLEDSGSEDADGLEPDPLFSKPPQLRPDDRAADGYLYHNNEASGQLNVTGNSGAEAVAGLEVAETARGSAPTLTNTSDGSKPPAPIDEEDSDDEQYAVDLALYGGFPGDVGYYGSSVHNSSFNDQPLARNASTSTYSTNVDSLARTTSVMTTSTMATTITQESDNTTTQQPAVSSQGYNWDIPDDYQLHPFPEFSTDAAGTGGLAEPRIEEKKERRLSFDEGEEEVARAGSDEDTFPAYPELFYHPPETTSGSSRPLPVVPQDNMSRRVPPGSMLPTPQFPRSTSLSSHGSAPVTITPARSKTDAANQKQNNRQSVRGPLNYSGDSTPQDPLISQLPAIPLAKKKFEPTKISTREFRKCTDPWALSAISSWVRELADGETYLRERTVEEGIVALFTHFVATMNIADAESLAARVVKSMIAEGVLVRDEEWVKFGDGQLCGVVIQICGNGCYAPKLHEQECPGRCYSHHCSRTIKQISLLPHPNEPQPKAVDWATFWEITKDKVETVSKKEIVRQNNLHEIVYTEMEYMESLWVLASVYRDQVLRSNPPIIQPSKLQNFVREVFGKADAVRKVGEAHLLPQLKFRQREQGPFIVGFSDIFREWIRKARQVYIEYAANFPNADWLVRREADRNLVFRAFLDQCRQDPRTKRLDWVTFLKAPITRLQRYSLLLSTVLKHTEMDSEEKQNLAAAIDEIKAVTLECDAKVDEQTKVVTLKELQAKLQMRSGMEVNLRLDDKGREVIFRGDLQRHTGRFNLIETHAILFDHYLILAKTVQQKDGGAKYEKYDVSRMPIPMGLLVLESTNDEPVVRSKLGISGPTTVKQTTPGGTRPQLNHPNTSLSTGSVGSAAGRIIVNSPSEASNDKIMYPFKIKHLGKPVKSDDNTYILYASSAQNRQDWCEKIIAAQERHATSQHAQNAEPFRLGVLADTVFGYETVSNVPKPIAIKGTPLDRAIREVEETFKNAGSRPPMICKALVNCCTSFKGSSGGSMLAIGADDGVYISDANNPRGWMKVISVQRVAQIAVLEDFNLFLVLADKALIAYHLDVVVPNGGRADIPKRKPNKLSSGRDVGFFTTGKMNDRTLVFYKERAGINTIFRVLEPIFQKASEKKSRFGKKGAFEFFREYGEFYVPTDCYGLNLFHSSLAIQTAKGFEVMKLDTKRPTSIPDLKASHVNAIASRLEGQKPLGMFRLSDIEFLLCYEDCAVYCNRHGDVSRSVIMEFVGKARTAAIYGPYILLFDNDFVEIRNAENGRLRQVIAGRDCRCLDDAKGGNQERRTVKVGMAHPEVDGRQLVIELILKEGQSD